MPCAADTDILLDTPCKAPRHRRRRQVLRARACSAETADTHIHMDAAGIGFNMLPGQTWAQIKELMCASLARIYSPAHLDILHFFCTLPIVCGSFDGNALCGLDRNGNGTYTAEGINKLCESLKMSSVTSLEFRKSS